MLPTTMQQTDEKKKILTDTNIQATFGASNFAVQW